MAELAHFKKRQGGWRPMTGDEWHAKAMALYKVARTPMERSQADAAMKFAREELTKEAKNTGTGEYAENISHKFTSMAANMMGSQSIGIFNRAKPEVEEKAA